MDVDEAVRRLAETDEQAAIYEAEAKIAPDKFKAKKAAIFLESSGTDGQKKALSESLIVEVGALDEYKNTVQEHLKLKNERSTLEKRLMLYQTRLSARAKGVVL